MSRLKFTAAVLAMGAFLGMTAPAARAVGVDVKTKGPVPVGAIVTLSHAEAQVIGQGQRLDIPGLPALFEKPFRKLAAKIKAADMGNGVKVTMWAVVLPKPKIKSKAEAR
jgi:hypothetical protein